MWLFPIEILKAFSDVFVLTFCFHGSLMKYYFDLYGIKFLLCHIEDGNIVNGTMNLSDKKKKIRERIELYDGNLNRIGDNKYALSASWFRLRSKKYERRKMVSLNIYNYLTNKVQSKVNDAMWSAIKEENDKQLKVKDYGNAFVPCNERATNEYADRHNLAYMFNVFIHPYIIRWFADHGIKVDEEAYALLQLLQWIWRSAIRNDGCIKLYLPSSRMRMLLVDWQNE
jgi:hypothetical protein